MKLIYVADGCIDDREAMKQYLELSGFEVQAFEEL
ncbi:MAG: caspase family protein, partial [Spirochaetales bacterium]|nr:caspase family protein [Spirochaetales bacterium]